jgi:MscS family membrane protein
MFVKLFITCFLLSTSSALIASDYQEHPDVSVKNLLSQNEEVISPESNSEQQKPLKAEEVHADVPIDEYERGQPRSAISGFLFAVQKYDYKRASQYMDFRNLSNETAAYSEQELARLLHVVLRRTIWIDIHAVSDDPRGNLKDGLPSYRELIGEIDTPNGEIQLVLQRVPRAKDRVQIWKISNATVEKIPYLSRIYSYSELGEWLSKHLPSHDFIGVELWQWVYFTALLTGYIFLSVLFTWLLSQVLLKYKPTTSIETHKFLRGPFALLLTIILSRTFVAESNVTIAVQALMDGATVLVFAWIWFFVRFIDLLKMNLTSRFLAQEKPLAIYLLRPASTVAKVLVIIIGILLWFENLGFSATTLLTGLGIGGLAIALAAQKTVENIIGAITLYISAPVKIGHVCRFDSTFGVVEEIGLRATRIRTIDRTVIHIANSQFVDMQLENISERERIAYRPKITLASDCIPANVELVLADIKSLLEQHESMAKEPLRVCLKGFSVYGLELDILAYLQTVDYEKYINDSNIINLSILQIIDQHQCKLANITKVALKESL